MTIAWVMVGNPTPEDPVQPSRKPTKKVTAGATAGSLTIVLVYALSQAGIQLPPEVASALTVLLGSAAAYLKRS